MPMAAPRTESTVERERQALNGWLALLLVVAWFVAGLAVIVSVGPAAPEGALSPEAAGWRIFTGVLMIGLGVFACFGFFTLEPNEARVLILFAPTKAPFAVAASIGRIRSTLAIVGRFRARWPCRGR